MPYVKRDDDGSIVAVSGVDLEGFETLHRISGDDMAAIISSVENALKALSQADMEFIRVIEDVVTVLVEQSQIQFTDLPEAAQRKILERQRIRNIIRPHLDLLPDDDNDKLI
ncbi:hypothetical protein [Amphritea sp. HPY]|uniref:hypothetical protein n=1 Tax=Amphritea sp. HPY TaxID=3421652 RepID=UPI003D7EAC9B